MEEDQELERRVRGRQPWKWSRQKFSTLHDMKNSEVEFCGYTMTHPSESKINLRILSQGALLAVEPFQRGLSELMNVCQHVLDKFEVSIKDYKEQKSNQK
uniref:RNA polymerase I and III subunit D n=1 Tax=Cavia porcellus TaxID=10141 RepID=A0A286XZC8_CAVPO